MAYTTALWIEYGTSGAADDKYIKIGGDSAQNYIDGPIEIDETNPDQTIVTASFVLIGSTATDFGTKKAAVENALRTPRLILKVKHASGDRHSWDDTAGTMTGFNVRPSFSTPEDDTYTDRSCRFNVRWEIDLPAERYFDSGQRDSNLAASYKASRRIMVTLTGEYRSTSSVESARAVYAAARSGLISAQDSAFSTTFEAIDGEVVTTDDDDKICTFSLPLGEIIYNQSLAGLNHAAIVDPILDISEALDESEGDGDSFYGATTRPAIHEVYFEAEIDNTVSPPSQLESLWTGTIRPHLLQVVVSLFGTGTGAVLKETPTLSPYGNKIKAEMTVLVVGSGTYMRYTMTRQDTTDPGEVLEPITTSVGSDRYAYEGPSTHEVVISEEWRERVGGGGKLGGPLVNKPGGGLGLGIAGDIDGPGIKINGSGGPSSGLSLGGIAGDIDGPGVFINFGDEGQQKGQRQGPGAPAGGEQRAKLQPSKEIVVFRETPLTIGTNPKLNVVDVEMVTKYEMYTPYIAGGGGGGPEISKVKDAF